MPSDSQRITQLENSIARIAANKLDTEAFRQHLGLEDTRYLDLTNAILDLQSRMSSFEQWVISHIAATGV